MYFDFDRYLSLSFF